VLTLHRELVAVRRLITIRGTREYDTDQLRLMTLLAPTIRCEPKDAVLAKMMG
jgi:hypothetical protein